MYLARFTQFSGSNISVSLQKVGSLTTQDRERETETGTETERQRQQEKEREKALSSICKDFIRF